MSDEIQKGETPAEVQSAEVTDTKVTAAETAETADFDKERAMETIKKLRAIEKEHSKAAKELEKYRAEDAKRRESEMSEVEKLKLRAEELETELRQVKFEKLRTKAATKYNLPDALAARLRGETEEELEADAKQLAELLPKEQKKPQLKANDVGDGQKGKTADQRRAELYNRGTNPFDLGTISKGGGGVFFVEKS